MNLYEKLNRLDDSLVESKTIVKKKKLTESRLTTNLKRRSFLKDVFDKYEILDLAEADDDFKGHSYSAALNHVLRNWDNYYLEDEFVAWLEEQEDYEDDYDDDIDEMLTESTEQYELSTLVKDSINHLVNDLGKDPMADDFGDDVCADLEDNYDIYVPQDPVKYANWCYAVMCEVSRQLNNREEELTEDANGISSQIPEDVDAFLQDLAQMYGMFDYKDIMKHEYTEEEIEKLRNYARRFNAEIEYQGDEEADAIMKDIAERVAIIIKHDTLAESQEELTAGTVYTLKEDAFICDNNLNRIKNYLSNPDDASIKHVQQTYLENEDIIIPRGTKLRYVREVLIQSFYYDMYSDGKVVFLFSTDFKKHLN